MNKIESLQNEIKLKDQQIMDWQTKFIIYGKFNKSLLEIISKFAERPIELVEKPDKKKGVNATIPEGIVEYLDLKKGDKLEWTYDTKNEIRIAVVNKKQTSQNSESGGMEKEN